MTLTTELITLINEREITIQDVRQAALFTLDAVVNTVAGRKTEPGQILIQWGALQGQDVGRRAFITGGLTHILETDDLQRASVTHPGCVVVPAALAMAWREKSSGPHIMKAILQGYEAMCRVGNAVGPAHYRIWHNTATCGPFGSAMATASLLGLSTQETMYALGNAGTQSSGVWEFLETGAMSKHLHAGRAAESGIIAADLARSGFTGPPGILEGTRGFFAAACPDPDPSQVTATPNAPWQLSLTSIKPWPCCRHTHPAIDAALELHGQLQGQRIQSVAVDTYQAALDVCNRPHPVSVYEAKFSLQHCVAVALNCGAVELDSFAEEARVKHRELSAKIDLSAQEPYVSAYPKAWGAEVRVLTENGHDISAKRDSAKGDPEFSLSETEMIAKAKVLLNFAECNNSDTQQIIDGVLELPTAKDTSHLLRFLGKQLY